MDKDAIEYSKHLGSTDLYTLYENGEITLEQLERWNGATLEVVENAKRYNAGINRARAYSVAFAAVSPFLGPVAVVGAAACLGYSFLGFKKVGKL